MKILVTGGTVFVSRFTAKYFAEKGNEVFVLNRGTREQTDGVTLIKADRHALGDCIRNTRFDAVLDICAYTECDVRDLLNAIGGCDDYILISSSAVYPETLEQPFRESQPVGENSIWGAYGTNKIAAEKYLLKHNPKAYILRPPYLYGPMQNLYREPFMFDCAEANRKIYIPKDGKMKLQFFHVEDLCKVMEQILLTHPQQHIFNVGNEEITDINEFADICCEAVGTKAEKVYVPAEYNQRDYFSFHDYSYTLDVSEMKKLLPVQKNLLEGLKESYAWYKEHREEVRKKPFFQYIDENLTNL